MFPAVTKHSVSGGGAGQHTYTCVRAEVTLPTPTHDFRIPATPLLPHDASFDPAVSSEVPVSAD